MSAHQPRPLVYSEHIYYEDEVTNTGRSPEVYYDAFGCAVYVMPGETKKITRLASNSEVIPRDSANAGENPVKSPRRGRKREKTDGIKPSRPEKPDTDGGGEPKDS